MPQLSGFSNASLPKTISLSSGARVGFVLRAAASIEKQVVYFQQAKVIESSGSVGMQLPTFLYDLVLLTNL